MEVGHIPVSEGLPHASDMTEKGRSYSTAQSKPRSMNAYPPVCRFYSRGKYCQFGRRCRFLHEHLEPRTAPGAPDSQCSGATAAESAPRCQGGAECPSDGGTVRFAEDPAAQGRTRFGTPKPPPQPVPRDRARRPCRYFLNGYCVMEERCRFWHPERLPTVRDPLDHEPARISLRPPGPLIRSAVPRPAVVKDEVKLTELTQEVARQLRDTEISQLLKRFPKGQLIVQKSEDGKKTYYRIVVEPTDPDWPFDLKELDIQISFPDDYPLEVFTLDIPEDQDLPASMARHVCKASEEWLQAKHATNRLTGKLELLFRPYLRWLDRNLEKLFIEGARKIKRDLDMEKSGIRFVPFQDLQPRLADARVLQSTEGPLCPQKEDVVRGLSQQLQQTKFNEAESPEMSGTGSEVSSGEEVDGCSRTDAPRRHKSLPAGNGSGQLPVESNSKSLHKGTAVRFVGFQLGEGTATLAAVQITVSLKCNRCKVADDLIVSQKQPCSTSCEKCSSAISATFQPSVLHENSDVMGYLDLRGCVPVDLIVQESTFSVYCLNCSKEGDLQGLTYGRYKELNCLHCHGKLSVFAEAAQFYQMNTQSEDEMDNKNSVHRHPRRLPQVSTIQLGKPLPEFGTCGHYKKSCRWLRFQCCGKAYPCDLCHDNKQDHLMEMATRMICGFCAKEQPYSNGKPCAACGAMMTKGSHTSHWEGGQGCRSQMRMSRKDKQKYANTTKTVSRRSLHQQPK
ncbi:uncharacterized protein si:dkey-24l11.2 [Leucoraja erinacea]|uniref:uncharacterized protein si:dkey-24l11.2 n=1 Tax=Leucoraja erinaceus TaxID=7782 RepID=UPI002458FAA5|nr:uncharacterized protein si:dkey-24l11.2 [Leucoraja erinacea]XP_055518593.1 uncharacterized protein si:dkey-24l11.2 [Leucoraja erinacea]